MSLDIWAEVNGESLCESINITHNSRPQVEALGVDPWEWHGVQCADTGEAIAKAVDEAKNNPGAYSHLDSPNGWGAMEWTTEFLIRLQDECERACRINPKAVWHVWR